MTGHFLESLVDLKSSHSFAFPETVFTTVTAYQNQQVSVPHCPLTSDERVEYAH